MFTVKRTKKGGGNTPPFNVSDLDPKPAPVQRSVREVAWEVEPPENPILNHYQAKKARAAAKAYIENSKAQRPTAKQVVKLSAELGYPGRAGLTAFIRFANGFIEPPFTRGHFVAAIDLAVNGRNHLGSLEALDQLSRLEGPLWTGHGETGASRRWKRKPSGGKPRNSV